MRIFLPALVQYIHDLLTSPRAGLFRGPKSNFCCSRYTGCFTSKHTHLICRKQVPLSQKIKKAQDWNVHCVSMAWLENCFESWEIPIDPSDKLDYTHSSSPSRQNEKPISKSTNFKLRGSWANFARPEKITVLFTVVDRELRPSFTKKIQALGGST